jgi:hypothetical protein
MIGERAKVAKQAKFDGLCGIYCLVNAVRNWGEHSVGENDKDTLRYMLEASDRLRLFTVSRVTGGFEAHELIDIFNEYCRSHRFPAKAIHLSAMAEALDKWKFAVQAKRVFEQHGQIVLPVEDNEHWVLAYDHDFEKPGLKIDDSYPGRKQNWLDYKMLYNDGLPGVILLPNNSTLKFPD